MKKQYLIFLLSFVSIYGMENLSLEKEIAQALGNLNFEKIEELCTKEAIDFKKEFIIKYKYPWEAVGFFSKTPFDFALHINNLELGKLLVRYGDKPDASLYIDLCCWGCYKFLPIFYQHCPEGLECFSKNLLHLAVDTHIDEYSHKLIAGILLFFPHYREKKGWVSNDSLQNYKYEKLTPLEYAKSGRSMFRGSAKEAIKIFEDEKLRNDTIEVVNNEFNRYKVKELERQLGLHYFIQGREIGMSFQEMKQRKQFFERARNNNLNLLENKD